MHVRLKKSNISLGYQTFKVIVTKEQNKNIFRLKNTHTQKRILEPVSTSRYLLTLFRMGLFKDAHGWRGWGVAKGFAIT